LGSTVFYRRIGLFKEPISPDPYLLELKENDFSLPYDKENWYIFQSVLSTMLEEYKTLRAESIQISSLMVQMLQIGMTIIGVIFAASAAAWVTLSKENISTGREIVVYAFYYIIPYFVLTVSILWLGEAFRFKRVGDFISIIETQV